MSSITFTENAFAHYLYWQGQDKKTLKKINRLLKSIEGDGALEGEGKPEKLKYREGEYSRHISQNTPAGNSGGGITFLWKQKLRLSQESAIETLVLYTRAIMSPYFSFSSLMKAWTCSGLGRSSRSEERR